MRAHVSGTASFSACILDILGINSVVPAEDIAAAFAACFQTGITVGSNHTSTPDKVIDLLKRLVESESLLAKQFSVPEFKSLGCGDYFSFLQNHISLLPSRLQMLMKGEVYDESSHMVCMFQHQLLMLGSQAMTGIWSGKAVLKNMISDLLRRQFPTVSFEIEETFVKYFLRVMEEYQSNAISTSILFSQTLMMTPGNESYANDEKLEIGVRGTLAARKEPQRIGSSLSQEAMTVFLNAPMLTDLSSWSHWDVRFAPGLGPLMDWLMNEANVKELLFLATKDGKLVRIDGTATVDSFLQSALQGAPFHMAVQLVSILAVNGGEKLAPLSLLKRYSCHAFDAIVNQYNGETDLLKSTCILGRPLLSSFANSAGNKLHNGSNMDGMAAVASRFFLDCLGYFPSEFCTFAADVLLYGIRSICKNAPSSILSACNANGERILLHDVGLILGITEWINDYHVFSSAASNDPLEPPVVSFPKAKVSQQNMVIPDKHYKGQKWYAPPEGENASGLMSKYCKVNSADHRGVISTSGTLNGSATEDFERGNADLIIQSIRRDEFGLDDNLANAQRDLLRKQHDRLGRALHCLSRELYSQDSHFLLELVQNADDNKYPANAHPTLAFILQESGIVVLNNEKGFSSENIRALCDVGNSTKKGSRSGYIGKKGIGFKSVFRISDAPEIHSNGFHVKFDIRDGEIGFVLPTLVSAANMSLFERLAVTEDDDKEIFWKTCIVLPFKEKMLEGGGDKNSVVSMFSDIHPALLLFLRQLHCIKFRNVLENSVVVMRKEALIGGVVRISYGKEAMDWFVARQELQANMDHDDARITEIALAFGLQGSADGKYVPCLDTQPVFAFLPLRTYGLRFILQGDFVLPSSREEVDGDSPWNQWLLSELPSLFIRSQQSFCYLPRFKDNLGHAITVYMSYVPLLGEVHGFFSGLPRLILSKLRLSNCLTLEGDDTTWVPPCKVLRNWSEHDRNLLPAEFLQVHLGIGFLNREIVLSDQLARSLGIQDFGLPTLVQVMESLCQKENGLRSMGLCWLSAWLNAVYGLHMHSPKGLRSLEAGTDILETLRTLPFIPLSDGTFSCTTEGDIWFHCDNIASGNDGAQGMDAFPNLYTSLRIVNPTFLSSSSADTYGSHTYSVDNIMRMLTKIGVKPLSMHEIIKAHIMPAMHEETNVKPERVLFTEYLCFIFVHFQSTCCSCHDEREHLISELRERLPVVTNYGCVRLSDVPVHFTEKYGCPVDTKKLLKNINMQWHEVDSIYLKHPSNRFISHSKKKWKEFLRELGVTEFVKVTRLDRNALDIVVTSSENRVSGATAVDWESAELVNLLSLLTSNKDLLSSRYLLEILDTLWVSFIDKTKGYYDNDKSTDRLHFTSSFMKSIIGCPWVASSMDDKLHYPSDLFHDCDSVRCILGSVAPYAVPKVKSANLLSSIGFKTKVTLEDAVKMLRAWRSLQSFKTSLAAMAKLYTFMWKEIGIPRPKIIEELISEPFIFVPSSVGLVNEAEILGTFLCPNEVYWHDSVGICDLMEANNASSDSSRGNKHPIRTLCGVYPGLMDFFVTACGVQGMPSFSAHVQMLQSLAETSLPSQAAKQIFRIFLALTEESQHGEVKPSEVLSAKESLQMLEFRVLPTLNDKWVSMHPSYGLVCWCADKKLAEEFRIVDGVTLLFLGEDCENEKKISPINLSSVMHALGIPALSEVLTREAINYGIVYSVGKSRLLEWALPYAQRYIRHLHPKRYAELRTSRICNLSQLRIVVVEKLFYRNVVKKLGITSGKRWEVSSLLQGDTLFVTQDSDTHSLYLEISHALFGRSPEVHFANFLQLITKMLESGCTTEQVELFIIESQKLPELPEGEVKWSVHHAESSWENRPLPKNSQVPSIMKPIESPAKRKERDVPKWWSAPRCAFPPSSLNKAYVDPSVTEKPPPASAIDLTISDCTVAEKPVPTSPIDYTVSDQTVGNPDIPFDAPELEDKKYLAPSRETLRTGKINPAQAMIVGRRGERLAFRHLAEKWGLSLKWVNEHGETGLPYDIIAMDDKISGDVSHYVEVKTTKSAGKDWFSLSVNEWQCAIALGDRYYIAHVLLEGGEAKRIVVFRNPTELCRSRKLSLAIVMPALAHEEEEEEEPHN